MTGFRVALGGAQAFYNIKPDLTTLGKVIGGGMPVGAFGGRKDVMQFIAPTGPVYQAGTLSGNPIAMSAGLAQMEALCEDGVYEQLAARHSTLQKALKRRLINTAFQWQSTTWVACLASSLLKRKRLLHLSKSLNVMQINSLYFTMAC